jgi:hypothetical protein
MPPLCILGMKADVEHFQEMLRLQELFEELNAGMYNPVGLNLLWPRDVAFLYVRIANCYCGECCLIESRVVLNTLLRFVVASDVGWCLDRAGDIWVWMICWGVQLEIEYYVSDAAWYLGEG